MSLENKAYILRSCSKKDILEAWEAEVGSKEVVLAKCQQYRDDVVSLQDKLSATTERLAIAMDDLAGRDRELARMKSGHDLLASLIMQAMATNRPVGQ